MLKRNLVQSLLDCSDILRVKSYEKVTWYVCLTLICLEMFSITNACPVQQQPSRFEKRHNLKSMMKRRQSEEFVKVNVGGGISTWLWKSHIRLDIAVLFRTEDSLKKSTKMGTCSLIGTHRYLQSCSNLSETIRDTHKTLATSTNNVSGLNVNYSVFNLRDFAMTIQSSLQSLCDIFNLFGQSFNWLFFPRTFDENYHLHDDATGER